MKHQIKFITPQFNRSEPIRDKYIPYNESEFREFMKNADSKRLIEVGFMIFDQVDIDHIVHGLFLFPGEWYNRIPKGFKMWGISMKQKTFVPGESDDDTRFGCLPYGVIKRI
ncbi:MAG: hypothetical protein IPK91_02580 [Saprospiraceae bacterium]|nr:hypothetical protein [Saprospiraceae bacterium]MBK8296175.1 hypothetical protein [Saprospiraceae bacterium]